MSTRGLQDGKVASVFGCELVLTGGSRRLAPTARWGAGPWGASLQLTLDAAWAAHHHFRWALRHGRGRAAQVGDHEE